MFILVNRWVIRKLMSRAQTGEPAMARTRFTPMVRRKVLLPAILAPVTIMAEPGRSRDRSLVTLLFLGINGWPIFRASKRMVSLIRGKLKSSLLYEKLARLKKASKLHRAS